MNRSEFPPTKRIILGNGLIINFEFRFDCDMLSVKFSIPVEWFSQYSNKLEDELQALYQLLISWCE